MTGTPRPGTIDDDLAAELPGLGLWTVETIVLPGASPVGLTERLALADDRFRGAQALALRARPVPQAHRAFFRQVGLDPDADRTPIEEAVADRLLRGTFRTGRRLTDALTLAVAETSVAVVAFDAAALDGGLTLREAQSGETLSAGQHAHGLAVGRLVLADEAGPVAALFGRLSAGHVAGPSTQRACLVAVQVPGVPEAHVAEALWLAAEAMSEPDR